MDLDDTHAALLSRLRRSSIILSEADTDEVRLAMLQLYMAGYVVQFASRANEGAMEWFITPLGMRAIRARS